MYDFDQVPGEEDIEALVRSNTEAAQRLGGVPIDLLVDCLAAAIMDVLAESDLQRRAVGWEYQRRLANLFEQAEANRARNRLLDGIASNGASHLHR